MVCHAVRAELVLVALQLTMTDDDASLFLYFLRSRMNRWIEDVWDGRADRIASSAGNVLPVLGPQTVASTAARWRFDRRPEGQRHSSRQQFPAAAVHRRPQSLWRRSVPLGLHLRMIPSAMKRKWFVSSFHPSFFFFFFPPCFVTNAEIVCKEDLLVKRQRRRRDSTVTIAVGSSLGITYLESESLSPRHSLVVILSISFIFFLLSRPRMMDSRAGRSDSPGIRHFPPPEDQGRRLRYDAVIDEDG